MNLNIPKNDFAHLPPREAVVQKICDIFLDQYPPVFEVATDGLGQTTKVIHNCRFTGKPEFTTKKFGDTEDDFIRESEMREAFNALRAAGYHVFRNPSYGTRTAGYKVIREDYASERWMEVEDLKDHWD